MGEMTELEQYVLQAAIRLAGLAGRPTTAVVRLMVDKIRPTLSLGVPEVRAILLRLADRGLLRMEKAGRTYQVLAPTLDELHQQAIDEDEARAIAAVWRQIPNRPDGDVRCAETGVEVTAVRTVRGGRGWWVTYPVWLRAERFGVMHVDRIFETRDEALSHATRSTRRLVRAMIAGAWADASATEPRQTRTETTPPTSSATVPGFRSGKLPPGWTPERFAKVASEIRAEILRSSAMAVPGQLAQATELVDRMVKRAQYDALRAVLAELDEQERPGAAFAPGMVRAMLNGAARKLGCRLPATGADQ